MANSNLEIRDSYKVITVGITLKSNSCELNSEIKNAYQFFYVENDISPDITYYVVVNCKTSSPMKHVIANNQEIIYTTGSYLNLQSYLDWSIMNTIISGLKELYLIHAGVVTLLDKSLVFPAESGAGKTTLIMELLKHNFKYLSDEIAPIDPSTLRVLPFPKGLNVKDDTAIFKEYSIGETSSVDYIIFPKYCSAKKPELIKISKAKAVINILRNTLNFEIYKEKSLDILIQLVKKAECYALTTNDLEETTNLILDLVE